MIILGDEDFRRFMKPSEWSPEPSGGLRRNPIHGLVVEVANVGSNYYQPIIDPDGTSPVFRHDGPVKRCLTLEQAKEHAWAYFKEVVRTLPHEEGPHADLDG